MNHLPIYRTFQYRCIPPLGLYRLLSTWEVPAGTGRNLACQLHGGAPPPTGGLTLFSLYVALSRSSGRSSIRLLREFDDELFRKGHRAELLEENDGLEELNTKTLAWRKEIGRDTRTP